MKIHHTHHTQRQDSAIGVTRRIGFTLVELLVVISIIALIMGLVISGLNRATKTAKRAAGQRSAAAIAQAVEQFRNEFGFLPPLIHDGKCVSANDDAYRPLLNDLSVSEDGPVLEQTGGPYTFKTMVVWSEGLDYDFFRRRAGIDTPNDQIKLATGTGWDDDGAWEDRRYSKYSLAYYLTGVLDKDVDGVRGPGLARPNDDGTFVGVGYPIGSARDRYEPTIDVDRRGVRIALDYIEPNEYPEHDLANSVVPERATIVGDYEQYQRGALVALVDAFGNAYRYYRWEQGRFLNGQLVVERSLDLNLPPVLIDPLLLAQLMNDETTGIDLDLTGGDVKLRDARFAIVSAGPDGLFGTENIQTIADVLRDEVPTDLEAIATMRHRVWVDNAVEVGQ